METRISCGDKLVTASQFITGTKPLEDSLSGHGLGSIHAYILTNPLSVRKIICAGRAFVKVNISLKVHRL